MDQKQIGRYQIRDKVGEGGMATVFRAYDPRFRRIVALKLLPQNFLHNTNLRARFEREAHTVAALEHPAIVPVYDFGEEAEQLYLVMRFMDGGSLSDRLRRGVLTLRETASILNRLAPALDEAHEQGIIHRDLKPANILFDRRNLPYLADFGIVKLSDAGITTLTAATGLLGTPAYMSPEQVQGKVKLDRRSDTYALGVILFQMLTGQLPFDADTPLGVAVQHVTAPVPKLTDFQTSTPAACQSIIARAMAKDREARYQTATALARAVTELAEKESDSRQEAAGSDATFVEARRQKRKKDRTAALYQDAVDAMSSGEWDEAISLLNRLLVIDPTYRDTVARLAEANRQKQVAELLERGHAALEREDWGEALRLADEILEADAYHEGARSLQARARAGREVDEAYAEAEALLRDEAWAEGIEKLALILARKPAHHKAVQRLEEAKAARQRQIDRLRQKGEGAVADEAWEAAVEAFAAALALAPDDAELESLLEHAQAQRARKEEADSLIDKAQAHAGAAEWEAAVAAARKALALQPHRDAYRAFLQQTERDMKRAERLASLYGKAQEAMDAEAWSEAVSLWEEVAELGDGYRDAKAQLVAAREALSAERERKEQLASLAETAADQEANGAWKTAAQTWREALMLAPEDDDVQQRLAHAREEAARQEQAAARQEEEERLDEEKTAVEEAETVPAGDEASPAAPAGKVKQVAATPADSATTSEEKPILAAIPAHWRRPMVILPLVSLFLAISVGLGYTALGAGATGGEATATATATTKAAATATREGNGRATEAAPAGAGQPSPTGTASATRQTRATPSATRTPTPSREPATATRTPSATPTVAPTETPTVTPRPFIPSPTSTVLPTVPPSPTQPPPTQPPPTQPPPTSTPAPAPTEPPTPPPPTEPANTPPPPTEPPPSSPTPPPP